MLPNDKVLMSVRLLDHVLLTDYSSMEHVTWKSSGRMCGWLGRILRRDSCISVSSWSKVPLLSICSVAVPLCRPLLPCPNRWHGSLPRHKFFGVISRSRAPSCSFTRYSTRRTVNYLSNQIKIVPSTRRSTLDDRAFSVAAARTWNTLPASVRSTLSLAGFRQQLKTTLFQASYP